MKIYPILLITFLLVSCTGLPTTTPAPKSSEYFSTLGGGFSIKLGGKPEYRYGINIVSKKSLASTNYLVVEYQNPSQIEPLIIANNISELKTSNVVSGATTYILTSPPVYGISPNTNYLVRILLYTDRSKSSLLGVHEQLVNSGHIRN